MKVLLCSIVKEQNKYLREWVEHYQKLGFSNIYLFDNNEENGGEDISEVISGYIDNGFVIVDTSIKGKPLVDSLQASVYNKCYLEQSKNYDWIAFYDTDEYLYLKSCKDISQWVTNKKYAPFQAIAVNWKTYTDNNILIDGDSTTISSYTDYIKDRRAKDSIRVKCIYRTKIKELFGKICIHGNTANIKMCNSLGKKMISSKFPYMIQNLDVAYLKHLKYRSVDGVCKKIMLFADQNKNHAQQILDEYLAMNKITEEKLQFLIENLKNSGLKINKIIELYDKLHHTK